jgi:hypothetical protein
MAQSKKVFDVSVTRVGYGHRVIQVQAETAAEAVRLAEDQAGNHEFSEHTSDYTVEGVTLVSDLNRSLHVL